MTKITIHSEYITLQQFLKFAGAVATGGEAKERVAAGEALVDGEICTMRGKKLRGGEVISFGGKEYEVVGQCF